jgi:hypothetical protein
VLDVTVPKVGLQRSRVVSPVGEGIAAGVPEHLEVRLKPELGLRPGAFDHAGEPSRGEGLTLLRCKHRCLRPTTLARR